VRMTGSGRKRLVPFGAGPPQKPTASYRPDPDAIFVTQLAKEQTSDLTAGQRSPGHCRGRANMRARQRIEQKRRLQVKHS
jgi:hypothetical protein